MAVGGVLGWGGESLLFYFWFCFCGEEEDVTEVPSDEGFKQECCGQGQAGNSSPGPLAWDKTMPCVLSCLQTWACHSCLF